MPDSLTALAHAKVNLVLEVLGKRPDGYHEIDTVLQEIELADRVSVSGASEWSVSASGPFAEDTPCDETNLALKAALLLSERTPGSHPLAIRLEKHIPAAGGLGGGASDAATTLRLLQRAWRGTREEDVQAVASAVGSDEAFFLVGGTARARGRGEVVAPLAGLPAHGVVLFVPGETIERKTARMFARLSTLPFDSGSVAESLSSRLPCPLTSQDVHNAFERVAFDLFPWLAGLWHELEAKTGEAVRLAGAGPCLFWIGPQDEAARVAERAGGTPCTIIRTRTVQRP